MMANPSGTHQEPGQASSSFNGGGNPSNGNVVPASENSGPPAGAVATAAAMKHNPGIAMDWTPEEQSVLEEGLSTFNSDSNIIRYAKIAMQLQNKTVRDVALRCRWMSKKENSKRRKEDHTLSRKSKDKKEKVSEPSGKSFHLASRANVAPFPMPMIPMDNDDGISYKAIGGSTGQLLEQNAQAFSQISANLASLQIQDNISLFCQARDNIQAILNDLNDMPEVMRQMPPLPVKINEELVNSILPRAAHPVLPRQP